MLFTDAKVIDFDQQIFINDAASPQVWISPKELYP